MDLTMKWLLEAFPSEHPVTLIWTDGMPEYRTQTHRVALKDLAKEYGDAKYFASSYLPPLLGD